MNELEPSFGDELRFPCGCRAYIRVDGSPEKEGVESVDNVGRIGNFSAR